MSREPIEKRELVVTIPYWQKPKMKRSPIAPGAGFGQKKAQQRVEEGFYPTWETLLGLHRLDYWHCTVSQRSQPGWPDYAVFGDGWFALVELKARRVDGGAGKVSGAQERYKASSEAAGVEWRCFLLPDQWDDVDDWLCAHTGREIRGTWR